VTILFADIRGFTSYSERNDPEQVVETINRYYEHITRIIRENEGIVDKYEGDAIMAFWGAPLPQADHARRACLAALDCQVELEKLREEFQQQGRPALFARIGLNSGEMIVGNMGSRERFDYTVLGDEVNLGSRLEGANKQYGTNIMVSERTYRLAEDDVDVRELDLIRVKGKDRPVKVYELSGRKNQLSPDRLKEKDLFERGLLAYRAARWKEAMTYFERLPEDPPSQVFLSRCRAYEQTPPSDEWDGVFVMMTK